MVYLEGLTWIKILDKYIGDIDSFIGDIDKIVTYWIWLTGDDSSFWSPGLARLSNLCHSEPVGERSLTPMVAKPSKRGASFAEGSSCIFFYKCIKVNTYEASGLIH